MARTPDSGGNSSSVGDVIADPHSSLASLFHQARTLARVESLLTGYASPEVAAQFQVAAMREDRLVLLTPSAAWATRLRMQAEQMLQFLQVSGFAHLRYIDIRVAPLSREPDPPQRVRRTLSPTAELALKHMRRLIGDS